MFASQLLSSSSSLPKQCFTQDLKTFASAAWAIAKVPRKLCDGDTAMIHQTYLTLIDLESFEVRITALWLSPLV